MTSTLNPDQQLNSGIDNIQVYRYAAQQGHQFTILPHRQYIYPEVVLPHSQIKQVNTHLDRNTCVNIPKVSQIVKHGVIYSEHKSVDVRLEFIIHQNNSSENM